MNSNATAALASGAAGYRVDDLVIDIGRRCVRRGDAQIPMSQLTFDLLLELARAAPNLLTFDELMSRVWPGLVVSPETVSQRVKVAREAIGDDAQAPRYILGVRGRGYRMIAPVSPWVAPQLQQASTARANAAGGSEAESGAALSPSRSSPPSAHPESHWPPTPPASPASVSRASASWRLSFPRGVRAVALGGLALAIAVASALIVPRLASNVPQRTDAERASVIVQPQRTIAVLPLVDIGAPDHADYLGDGLAEELSSRLARLPGLRVASRTSTFALKGRQVDVRAIARSLGVRHVLEGSVRRDGDQLRIAVRLIDSQTGHHVWAQTYDRQWRDLLAIEEDVAQSIVAALSVVLSDDMARRLERQPTSNLAAFDSYLAGLAQLRQMSARPGAEEDFRQAIALDPGFARAYAGLCEVYVSSYESSRDTSMVKRAESACARALALDNSLVEVDLALGHLYTVSGRGAQALATYRRAIAKNPADADSYLGLAETYERQQQLADAEAAYERAIEVEPGYWATHTAFGNFLLQHGRAGEAIAHYRRVTELAPGSASALNNLGVALQLTGDFDGAARSFERSLRLEPTRSAYSNTGAMYYYLGRFSDAAAMFRKAGEMAVDDHRVWGNLADALSQMKNGEAEATGHYRRAIELASRELEINANDAVTTAQLAYYYARVGDTARAPRLIDRARKLGSDVIWVDYYASLVALERGDPTSALESLGRAVASGFPVELVRAAPEFSRLRNDPRYEKLLVTAAHRASDER